MPLAFESKSHGTIAFGFFNIESDMLLLDRYFLFASDFCSYIEAMVETLGADGLEMKWQVQYIDSGEKIGDLMGAIHGIRYTGFIGEVYRHFPFPQEPSGFKQKPEGDRSQILISEIITNYGRPLEIPVTVSPNGDEIEIGVYQFTRSQFQNLLNYVWLGGAPRWKDGLRPDYVKTMYEKITHNNRFILKEPEF